jgi:hypothetical protein
MTQKNDELMLNKALRAKWRRDAEKKAIEEAAERRAAKQAAAGAGGSPVRSPPPSPSAKGGGGFGMGVRADSPTGNEELDKLLIPKTT